MHITSSSSRRIGSAFICGSGSSVSSSSSSQAVESLRTMSSPKFQNLERLVYVNRQATDWGMSASCWCDLPTMTLSQSRNSGTHTAPFPSLDWNPYQLEHCKEPRGSLRPGCSSARLLLEQSVSSSVSASIACFAAPNSCRPDGHIVALRQYACPAWQAWTVSQRYRAAIGQSFPQHPA